MKKIIKDEKGYSFVQFILVLPIMIIMLGLLFDMGRAVYAKSNLQHLAGEIQKVVVLYEEAGVKGGIREYSQYNDIDKLVKKVINENTQLDKSKLKHKIDKSKTKGRNYIGHHYNPQTESFARAENRNDIKYVTVTVEYEMPYYMFITKNILGDSIKLSESYTGIMYVGGDGWDKEDKS